jgi:S-formylglutathione hydrolase FrmB
MALIHLNFHSDVLGMGVNAEVILPQRSTTLIGMDTGSDAATCKTLYLLHGLSDDHTIWQRRTSIERYAAKHDLAVVMPNAHRSWYTDMAHGGRFFTFISEELPRVCQSFFRCMSPRREDNYIAGLSMGGYGAMKIAYSAPERFAGVAAFSGAFDVYTLAKNAQLDNRGYWEDIFGDIESIPGSKHDVYALVKKAAADPAACPKTYVWCGTEDWLIGANREMRDLLDGTAIEHLYAESAGVHAWEYWDEQIQRAMDYFFQG